MLTKLLRLSATAVLSLSVLGLSAAAWGAEPNWIGTWGASAMQAQGGAMRAFTGMTLRQVVRVSAGGTKVRVRFTNEFGTDPLSLADAHVALAAGGSAVKEDHKLTFGGESSVRIAQGAAIFSDPVELNVAPLSDLAISFYVPNQVLRAETYHALGLQTNYAAVGDVAGAAKLDEGMKFSSWYFLSGVDVAAPAGARAIVTLGDSITDGAKSTPDTNRRWPNILAERLQKTPGLESVSVIDEGISGNRILNEGAGPSALARFDRDVLAQDGVKYLVILESINDIGHTLHPVGPEEEITVSQLENVVGQMALMARQRGIKVYGATLTPYVGAGYAGEKGEQMRSAYNNWIRTSPLFDAVIDFEKAVGDGAMPPRFQPAYDSGDHLHPGDAGYKAMGEAIDLKLFQ